MDRPILFSGPMVRAILSGAKTQTRRVLKPQPVGTNLVGIYAPQLTAVFNTFPDMPDGDESVPLRYMPGDRLWVRESYAPTNDPACSAVYRATIGNPDEWRWTPSIHMPRWASRLTLDVTDVRVQRLQDISLEDAIAEGVKHCERCNDVGWLNTGPDGGRQCDAPGCGDSCIPDFRELWNSLNEKRGFGWNANPWVVAVTFKAHECNIDHHTPGGSDE